MNACGARRALCKLLNMMRHRMLLRIPRFHIVMCYLIADENTVV